MTDAIPTTVFMTLHQSSPTSKICILLTITSLSSLTLSATRAKLFMPSSVAPSNFSLLAFIAEEKERELCLLFNQDDLVENVLAHFQLVNGSIIDYTIVKQKKLCVLYKNEIAVLDIEPLKNKEQVNVKASAAVCIDISSFGG